MLQDGQGWGNMESHPLGWEKSGSTTQTQKEPLLQNSNSIPLWLYCVCILKELKLEVESREVQMLRPNVLCERTGKAVGG